MFLAGRFIYDANRVYFIRCIFQTPAVPTMNSGTELVSKEDCLEILRRKFSAGKFRLVGYESPPLNDGTRTGFLGDHYRLKLQIQRIKDRDDPCKDNGEFSTINLFAKVIPQNETLKRLVQKMRAFEKETLFYELLSGEYTSILGPSKMFPDCYLAKDGVIVLEDLGERGLRTVPDTREPLDLSHIKQVVLSLAHLHAASLVAEETSKTRMDERFPELVFETCFVRDPDHPLYSWVRAGVHCCAELLPDLPKYRGNPAVLRRARARLPGLVDAVFDLVRPEPLDRARNVLCQGDPWASNFLFRYEQGKPVAAAVVDYQALRYCAPALELVMCLHLCTSRDEREKNFTSLCDEYYHALAVKLGEHNLNIRDLLPREEFDSSCEKHKLTACVLCVLYYPVTHMNKDLIEEVYSVPERYTQYIHVDRSTEVRKYFAIDKRFRSAMNEAMETLIDNFILKEE